LFGALKSWLKAGSAAPSFRLSPQGIASEVWQSPYVVVFYVIAKPFRAVAILISFAWQSHIFCFLLNNTLKNV